MLRRSAGAKWTDTQNTGLSPMWCLAFLLTSSKQLSRKVPSLDHPHSLHELHRKLMYRMPYLSDLNQPAGTRCLISWHCFAYLKVVEQPFCILVINCRFLHVIYIDIDRYTCITMPTGIMSLRKSSVDVDFFNFSDGLWISSDHQNTLIKLCWRLLLQCCELHYRFCCLSCLEMDYTVLYT